MMGQMKQRRDSEMEDVYAGPPMPDDIDEPEITEPEDIETTDSTDKVIKNDSAPQIDPRMYSTMMVYAGPAGPARMSDDTSALGMMGAMMNNNPFFKTGTAGVSGNNEPPASSNTDNSTTQKDTEEKADGDGEDSGNGTWV